VLSASALLEHGLPPDFVTPLIKLITNVLDGCNARLADGVSAPWDGNPVITDVVAKSRMMLALSPYSAPPPKSRRTIPVEAQ
jgi:hypothetical protein